MRLLLVGTVIVSACTAPTAEPERGQDAATVTLQLAQQFSQSAAAWNGGDLDRFMADYVRDSTTTYVGGNGKLIRGFDAIRARYAPAFAPDATRDTLRFTDFLIRPLAPGLVLVSARYELYRDTLVTASGPFTLIMEQRADGWKILHDHSSSDQP